jgi:hypothetical protein
VQIAYLARYSVPEFVKEKRTMATQQDETRQQLQIVQEEKRKCLQPGGKRLTPGALEIWTQLLIAEQLIQIKFELKAIAKLPR